MEQTKLLELLQEIKEIAHAQQNVFTKEEVKKYLGNEELEPNTLKAIYQYLGENGIRVEGYEYVPVEKVQTGDGEAKAEQVSTKGELHQKKDRGEENLSLYKKEVSQITGEINDSVIAAFLNKETVTDGVSVKVSAKDYIIERYLERVMELAETYKKRTQAMDELIAEGNMGLILAMNQIENSAKDYWKDLNVVDRDKFFGTLEREVKQSMEQYIDETVSAKDWENAMLAKTNLLHEAVKYLSEENGTVPTARELAEYTKLSPAEINDIMDLSKDIKKKSDTEGMEK